MRKKVILLFIKMIMVTGLFAKMQEDSVIYIPYHKGNKWGICDINKNIVVAPEYDYIKLTPGFYNSASIFLVGICENFAKDSNDIDQCTVFKYGYINNKGEKVIPIQYDYLYQYSDLYAGVDADDSKMNFVGAYKNGKWGLLSKANKVLVPFVFDEAPEFDEIVAYTEEDDKEDDDYYIYNRKKITAMYSVKTGEKIIVPTKPGQKYNYRNGIIEWDKKGLLLGYDVTSREMIDINSGKIIQLKYDKIGDFIDGLCLVEIKKANGKNLYGLIDHTGKEIIPVKYNWIVFDDLYCSFKKYGTFIVENNNKYGLIDIAGNALTPLKYDNIDAYDCDRNKGFFKVRLNEKYGWIDNKGKEIIPPKYDYYENEKLSKFDGISWNSKRCEGVFFAKKAGKKGIVNTNGEEIIPFKYDELFSSELHFFEYDFIWAKRNHKWALVGRGGKEIIPPTYDKVEFSGGGFVVTLNNKIGYVNSLGKIIASPKYDEICSKYRINTTSSILVKKSNKYILITDDKEIAVINYDKAYLTDGYIKVQKNKKFGMVNLKGKEILAPKYDQVGGELDNINDGDDVFKSTNVVKLNNKWAFVDSTGKFLTDFIYDYVNFCARESLSEPQTSTIQFSVAIKDKCGYVDKYGKVIIPIEYNYYNYDNFKVVNDIHDGYISVKTKYGEGLFYQDGNIILKPEYKYILPVNYDLLYTEKNDKEYGYINKSGIKYYEE